jgi:N-acetylneuraminic acid mutarotase
MNSPISQLGTELRDFWEYDPITNTWTQKANYLGNPFGSGVYYATGFAVNGKGYVCCGKIGFSSYLNQLWEYDPVTNSWLQRPNFPGGVRYGLSSFVVNGKAYVGLGTNEDSYTRDLWEYNPSTNLWAQKADLPGSARFSSTGFSIGTKGYIVLGGDGGYRDDLFEYDPASNSWYVRAPFGGGTRRSAAGFAIGTKAYVGTGKGLTGCRRDFWEYNPYVPAGWNELSSGSIVSVYPNPMTVAATLEIYDAQFSTYDFELYDVKGNLVKKSEIEDRKSQITKDDLSSGAYFYRVSSQNRVLGAGKLIVQ